MPILIAADRIQIRGEYSDRAERKLPVGLAEKEKAGNGQDQNRGPGEYSMVSRKAYLQKGGGFPEPAFGVAKIEVAAVDDLLRDQRWQKRYKGCNPEKQVAKECRSQWLS